MFVFLADIPSSDRTTRRWNKTENNDDTFITEECSENMFFG
jgi:hypothetical protein